MLKSARAIAGAAIVVMLLSAGCGGSSGTQVLVEATPAAMRRAAQSTLAEGTSKVEFTIGMTVQGQDVTMTGTGQVDPAAKRFAMSFDAKDLFRQLLGSSSVPPEASAMFDQPIDMVLDGAVMYMHFPLLASVAGGGKEWLKIDLAAANNGVGDLLGGGGGGGGVRVRSFFVPAVPRGGGQGHEGGRRGRSRRGHDALLG